LVRANRRASQKKAIDDNRQFQLDEKQRRKQQETEIAKEQMQKWSDYNQRVEQAIRMEESERRLENIRLAAEQRQQSSARRSIEMVYYFTCTLRYIVKDLNTLI